MDKKEQEAFVKAYLQFGDAPREYVEDFIKRYYSDVDVGYDEYYTQILDALSMWRDAIEFANNQEEHKRKA